MFGQIFTIARNTFTESIRQPIFLVVLGVAGMILVMNLLTSAYTLDDDNMMLITVNLSVILAGGTILAAFLASGVLAREIQNKTALTVISKPIGRPAFVLGKFIGVTGAIALACWIWAIIFLLLIRHRVMQTAAHSYDFPVITFGLTALLIALVVAVWGNYFYGWVFTSRFTGTLAATLSIAFGFVLMINSEWQFQPITAEFLANDGRMVQVVIALGLLFQALVMLSAIAIACSTRLGQVMTLIICLGIGFIGASSDYLFGQFTQSDATLLAWLAHAAWASVPNIGFTWLADALTKESPITGGYFGIVSAYAALYTAAALALAAALFQTREAG